MKPSDPHLKRFSVLRLPRWVVALPVALLLSEGAVTAVHAHLHSQEDFAHPCATCAISHTSATPIVVTNPVPISTRPERVHAVADLAPVPLASPATSSRGPPKA